MKKAALYSRSGSGSSGSGGDPGNPGGPATSRTAPDPAVSAEAAPRLPLRARLSAWLERRDRLTLFAGGAVLMALFAAAPALIVWQRQAPSAELQQDDIDAAVLHTLETQPLPSRAAKAAELVRQSVVRVRGWAPVKDGEDDGEDEIAGGGVDKDGGKDGAKDGAKNGTKKQRAKGGSNGDSKAGGRDANGRSKSAQQSARPKAQANNKSPAKKGAKPDADEKSAGKSAGKSEGRERVISTGTGVVILENGTILTNLHVVAGAKRLTVTFSDGMESDAVIVGLHPENDLAVIRAKKIPDDLPPATMGASGRLKPGDEVVAVGFPFGIGPSVSAGVVSGTGREFRSPKGERKLTGLIQFDAAANSGNSGGPLITMEGEVVGIVTAILNPTRAGTFIGIGFAVTIEGAGLAVGVAPF